MPDCRLYLVTPQALEPARFAPLLAEALDAGDVGAVQLRLKEVDDDTILRAAEALMPICVAADVAFIVNDRPDLAVRAGADGAHVGATDTGTAAARKLLGKNGQLGVSCYASRDAAIEAGEAVPTTWRSAPFSKPEQGRRGGGRYRPA